MLADGRVQGRGPRVQWVAVFAGLFAASSALGQGKAAAKGDCRAVVVEGQVKAGEAFRREFAPGRELSLEPLKSGWIVRVLEVHGGREVREPRDWAEVATPPFRSVSPLQISTDWAFRAQDAAAWNPRPFRYAATAGEFRALAALEDRVNHGDRAAEAELAARVGKEPEGTLHLLDVELVPGTRDQAGTAAMVATHLAGTPHEVLQGERPTPLGRLAAIRFRVKLDLPAGTEAERGLFVERFSCALRPTE